MQRKRDGVNEINGRVITVIFYTFTASPLVGHPDFGKLSFFECLAFLETEHSAVAVANIAAILAHEKLSLSERGTTRRLEFSDYSESGLPPLVVQELKNGKYSFSSRPREAPHAQN